MLIFGLMNYEIFRYSSQTITTNNFMTDYNILHLYPYIFTYILIFTNAQCLQLMPIHAQFSFWNCWKVWSINSNNYNINISVLWNYMALKTTKGCGRIIGEFDRNILFALLWTNNTSLLPVLLYFRTEIKIFGTSFRFLLTDLFESKNYILRLQFFNVHADFFGFWKIENVISDAEIIDYLFLHSFYRFSFLCCCTFCRRVFR